MPRPVKKVKFRPQANLRLDLFRHIIAWHLRHSELNSIAKVSHVPEDMERKVIDITKHGGQEVHVASIAFAHHLL